VCDSSISTRENGTFQTILFHLNWCWLSIHFIWTGIGNQFNSFKLQLKTQFFDSVQTNCWPWTVTHLLSIPYTLIGKAHERVWVPRCRQSALAPTFFSFWEWCCSVWNLFTSSKNPFLGIPLQNVKENDLILMESYPDFSKKERKRNHSDRLWNGSESFWFRWGMSMDLEESMERQRTHSSWKDSFSCFNECIHFRSFSWTFFTG